MGLLVVCCLLDEGGWLAGILLLHAETDPYLRGAAGRAHLRAENSIDIFSETRDPDVLFTHCHDSARMFIGLALFLMPIHTIDMSDCREWVVSKST